VSAKKRPAGGGTPATVAATQAKIKFELHPYEADPAADSYGEAAADALGVPYEQIFKTLLAEVDGRLTVAVVPVAGQLDLKALASAVGGKKAQMADPATAERTTGYVLGGISPLGQRKRLTTVIDESASTFPTIFVSAGRRGLQIELAPVDLITLTGATTAEIGRS
jgi:Cys-tRNA(Pro)/Cys-tRNA(Cys) deacylase